MHYSKYGVILKSHLFKYTVGVLIVKKLLTISLILILSFPILFTYSKVCSAQLLLIDVKTDQQIYGVGEKITVNGTVYYGTPLTTLIGIEISDAFDHILTIRTLVSGDSISGNWNVEVLDVTPCDSNGIPKQQFNRGDFAFFMIKVRNNMDSEEIITLTLSIYFAGGTAYTASPLYHGPIMPKSTYTTLVSLGIPTDAPLGVGTAYANVYKSRPKNGGYPLCPEKAANFTVIGSGTPLPYIETAPKTAGGIFTLYAAAPKTDCFLGNYTVYATAFFYNQQVQDTTIFSLILRGDVNLDGKVDLKDIVLIIGKFGTKKGDPNWQPIYDLNFDNKVDLKDIVISIANFGNSGYYPK